MYALCYYINTGRLHKINKMRKSDEIVFIDCDLFASKSCSNILYEKKKKNLNPPNGDKQLKFSHFQIPYVLLSHINVIKMDFIE